MEISVSKYCCRLCNYKCDFKYRWENHTRSLKHMLNVNKSYSVCPCGKRYKYKSGLSKHKKTCDKSNNKIKILLKEIHQKELSKIKEIQKLKDEYNEELMKHKNELIEAYKTNNNNTININIFLNESCKDAMNLTDFIETITLSIEDLDYTGKHGYIEGISNILTKRLCEIDPMHRPIHCTDKKRMLFYIKDEDKWEKDKNNEKIGKSIAKVTSKQYDCIKKWQNSNEGYENSGDKVNDFFKIASNSYPVEENCSNKVMKKVAGTIHIKEAMSNI